MRKGVNALEVVFGMFLLLIVVFVVIRLITNFVTPSKVTGQLQSFDEAYKYSEEKAKCKNLCDEYTTEECNRREAVKYCIQKIKIDIDGNKNAGEAGHGGFVAGVPYCEDGLYCFHVYDCKCGSYKLTAENCRKILCEYYINDVGLKRDEQSQEIQNLIQNQINYGTCDPNPQNWGFKNAPETGLTACTWAVSAGFYDEDCNTYKSTDQLCS